MNKFKTVFEEKVADKEKILSNILEKSDKVSEFKYNIIQKVAIITVAIIIFTFVLFELVPRYNGNKAYIGDVANNKSGKTNNIIDENNSNEIQKYIDNSEVIPENEIYTTFSYTTSISDEAFDLSNTSVVYERADLVITGTIIEKDKGTASEISPFPYIPAKVKIDKIIKGYSNSKIIDIIMPGGTCTVADFVKASEKNFPERILKMGLDKLSEKDKQEKYIQFNYKYAKDFKVGNRYVIMLSKTNDEVYSAISNAGFLDINENTVINNKDDIINLK